MANTNATYSTSITVDLPDYVSQSVTFTNEGGYFVSGNDEVLPLKQYTLALDANGTGTQLLPCPDNTGDLGINWRCGLPSKEAYTIHVSYDASAQALGDLLAAGSTTTDPDVITTTLALKVNKSGDTMTGDLTMSAASIVTADNIGTNTSYTITGSEPVGSMFWNSDEETIDLKTNANITLQMGQETFFNVKNQTGADITNGTPVMFAGTVGASGRVLIQKAIADGSLAASYIMGLVTEDIANGADGKVTWFGKVRGIDTTGTPYGEVWADGEILYVSTATAGYLTKTRPEPPYTPIQVAAVIKAHASTGTLLVRPTWGDGEERLIIACSDESSDLATATPAATFRMPCALTLTEVRASVKTAPVGSAIQVDINESGSTILGTKLTIDAGEKTSTTAATPAVISDSALADDAEITIDIDAVGSSTAGAGLKVTLIGYRTV